MHCTNSCLCVLFFRPEGSRDSSLEHFAVGFDHHCPEGYSPRMLLEYLACGKMENYRQTVIPFVIYGEMTSQETAQHSSQTNINSALDRESTTTENEANSSADSKSAGIKYGELEEAVECEKNPDVVSSLDSPKTFVWKSFFPSVNEIIASFDGL